MQIIHRIDNFLYTIFPSVIPGDQQSLLHAIQEFYTYGPHRPKVTIENDLVSIDTDIPAILAQDKDYQKVIAYCEKGKYAEAKPILKKLIKNNPSNSEYQRIMRQILSDEGEQEEAINCLIDALLWESKNGWELLMMGNIFAKFKNNVPTAINYYDQALIANPKDYITINSIGVKLMQYGKLEEAKKYFYEALKINDQYANTHFTLGMVAEMEDDFHSAFYSTIQSIKLNKSKDILYQNAERPAFDDYRINSIKDKSFLGHHILAYYYVSRSMVIPEMVSQLNLP
jgi:tetratricopeptide (TPR) repeat protein